MIEPREAPQTADRLTRRRLVRASAIGVAGLAIVPVLSACAPVSAEDRVLVEMSDDNRFQPAGVTIPAGATVVWQNGGTRRHTATCDPALAEDQAHVALPAGATPWSSDDLLDGQSWQHTFTTPGTYLYFCRHHEVDGMLGTVFVTEGTDGAA